MRFKFTSPTHSYSCQLKCTQCSERTLRGARCRVRTCIGVPYCWHHLRVRKLRIGPSTLPNAGKGLFAFDPTAAPNAIVFARDDTIIEYIGEIISKKRLDSRYGDYTAPYALQQSRNKISDAACERGVASLANTSSKTLINAKFYYERAQLIMTAIKAIRNGQEIFVDYGKEYGLDEPNVKFSTR